MLKSCSTPYRGMAQWWKRTPPTVVARVRFLGLPFSSLHKHYHSNFNSAWKQYTRRATSWNGEMSTVTSHCYYYKYYLLRIIYNFIFQAPLPKIKLNSFTVSDCSSAPGQIFEVKISSVKTPICLKGDFHISGQHPGRFSIVYKAAISGKIMGFIPYALDIPLCKNPDGAKSW